MPTFSGPAISSFAAKIRLLHGDLPGTVARPLPARQQHGTADNPPPSCSPSSSATLVTIGAPSAAAAWNRRWRLEELLPGRRRGHHAGLAQPQPSSLERLTAPGGRGGQQASGIIGVGAVYDVRTFHVAATAGAEVANRRAGGRGFWNVSGVEVLTATLSGSNG